MKTAQRSIRLPDAAYTRRAINPIKSATGLALWNGPASPAFECPAVRNPSELDFNRLRAAYRATGGVVCAHEPARLLEENRPTYLMSLEKLITLSAVIGFDWRGTVWIPMFQFGRRGAAWSVNLVGRVQADALWVRGPARLRAFRLHAAVQRELGPVAAFLARARATPGSNARLRANLVESVHA